MTLDLLHKLDDRVAWLNTAINDARNLNINVTRARNDSNDWRVNLDISWMLTMAFLTFLIVIGFALKESGWTRRRHVHSTIFNHAAVAVVVALFWWFTGFAFAFGGNLRSNGPSANRNGFIGSDEIFLQGERQREHKAGKFPIGRYDDVFFHWAVTTVSSLLISGANAERLSNWAFLFHTALYSGFLWPVIAHWLYSDSGFFSPFSTIAHLGKNGVIDTGFSAVHICGGAATLAALIFVGPRKGEVASFANGNNRVSQVAGTFFQWAGWFGLTMGGVYHISSAYSQQTSRVSINVALSAGVAGFHTWIWRLYLKERFELTAVITGAMSGLVGIAAGCAVVEPFAAMLIGGSSSALYLVSRHFLHNRFGFDDALGSVSVHFVCGLWSMLQPGIWATHANTVRLLRPANYLTEHTHHGYAYGFLYGGDANQFGVQIFAAVLITIWTFIPTLVWAAIFNAVGILRVKETEEEQDEVETVKQLESLEDQEVAV